MEIHLFFRKVRLCKSRVISVYLTCCMLWAFPKSSRSVFTPVQGRCYEGVGVWHPTKSHSSADLSVVG